MGSPLPIQSSFLGFRQDPPREEIAGLYCWAMNDWLPLIDSGNATVRGPWGGVSTVTGSNFPADALTWADFSSGSSLVVYADHPNVHSVSGGGYGNSPTLLAAGLSIQPNKAFFHRDHVIFTAFGGATVPWHYFSGANAALTAPNASMGAVWKDFSWLAGNSSSPNRVWYSAPGDPTSWDTSATGRWYDTSQPVTALGPVGSVMLVFHGRTTERLRGTPGGTDFVREGVFNVGCSDQATVGLYQNMIVWADGTGVYTSDGSSNPKDLTAVGGIKQFYVASGIIPTAGGVYRDNYILYAASPGITLVYNFTNGSWTTFSGCKFTGFAHSGTAYTEQTYVLTPGAAVGGIESIWTNPGGWNDSAEPDNNTPAPSMETGLFRGWQRLHRKFIPSEGKQNWRTLYFDYMMGPSTFGQPTISVSYGTDAEVGTSAPSAPTYTSLATLTSTPTSSTFQRVRVPLRIGARGLALKLVVNNAMYTKSPIYLRAIEADYTPREVSRLV